MHLCNFCDIQDWGVEREYVALLSRDGIIRTMIQVVFSISNKIRFGSVNCNSSGSSMLEL